MNLGAMLVLVKLFQDAVGPVSLVGPPAPNDVSPSEIKPIFGFAEIYLKDVSPSEIKPTCGPGKYAYQNPDTGFWFCRDIPKGR